MVLKKYRVSGVVSGSKLIGIFEAENEQEAKKMAQSSKHCIVALYSHCAEECDDAQITLLLAEKEK